jgi:predicted DNA binding CopG/RHH family protein
MTHINIHTISKKSVEFFKSEAAKRNTQYQRMIRRLLDAYFETQTSRPSRLQINSAQQRAGR